MAPKRRITYRQSKASIALNIAVSIFMVAVGIFMLISANDSFATIFISFWLIFVITSTVISVRRACGDKGYTPEIEIYEDSAPTAGMSTANESAEQRLEQLRQIYERRLITSEEYEQKKAEILRQL